jgi:hypothetical protein
MDPGVGVEINPRVGVGSADTAVGTGVVVAAAPQARINTEITATNPRGQCRHFRLISERISDFNLQQRILMIFHPAI